MHAVRLPSPRLRTIDGRSWHILACFGVIAVLAFCWLVWFRPLVSYGSSSALELNRILLWQILLPRAAVALLAGGALGLSGLLMQRVLRNPIADASTLGIASGAQLALTVAIVFMPALMLSREVVAFAGAIITTALVLGLNWRELDPVKVALTGMMVVVMMQALSATLILAQGDYAMSIFVWGAGALNQQNWDVVLDLAPRLVLGWVAAFLLQRPLVLLGLNEDAAKSLGLGTTVTRLFIMGLAVWLSAVVTAKVGVIGFLGLAAPALARLGGAQTLPRLMIMTPLAGAALLLLTDCAVQLLGDGFTDLAPTGAAIALIGGPLILLLLPKLRTTIIDPSPSLANYTRGSHISVWLLLGSGLLAIAMLTLFVGRGPQGLTIATGSLATDFLQLRWPRLLSAGMAGALLAAAGFVMQRMTGNPLASPDAMGVSAGGGLGLAAVLYLFTFPSQWLMLTGLAAGSMTAFLIMLAFTAHAYFRPERLLLAGLAISAFSMSFVSIIMFEGSMRSYALLTWVSGSTNRNGPFEAWLACGAAIVLIPPLLGLSRWMRILPLGTETALSIGLNAGVSRFVLSLIVALMTAIASFIVGPLSLIGLIAPHLARMAGFRHPNTALCASALFGAGLLVFADWLARIVIYPYEVPVGLFAALIGGPYLIILLNRKGSGA